MLILLFLTLLIRQNNPTQATKSLVDVDINRIDTLPQYFLLQKMLNKYEKNVEYDAKGKIDFFSTDTLRVLQEVGLKLYHLGYEVDTNYSAFSSKRVKEAMNQFQMDHSLQRSEKLTKEFISLINVPIIEWIKKIKVNMERAAQIPAMNIYQVLINIPSFEMFVYDHDSLVLKSDIIVGKRKTKTALINGVFEYVVFNPYWNIPNSILVKEIMPEIKKDPAYIQKNDMEWIDNRLRQRPGPKNALGKIKFIFPNSQNMYLHDTPNKTLFSSSRRMFSHGCIRIAKPDEFAHFLLSKEGALWTKNFIEKKMAQKYEEYIRLKARVHIFIHYLTVYVSDYGRLQFRNDIYGLD